MGLDFIGPNKSYHYGYSGIHQIRWIAYKLCGGKKKFSSFMGMQEGRFSKEDFEDWCRVDGFVKLKDGSHCDWEYLISLQKFPNLMWHCDNEGNYTPEGKVSNFDEMPLTGNSLDFEKELLILSKSKKVGKFKKECCWKDIFKQLLETVQDINKNGNGIIEFH